MAGHDAVLAWQQGARRRRKRVVAERLAPLFTEELTGSSAHRPFPQQLFSTALFLPLLATNYAILPASPKSVVILLPKPI
jgi:hypothetical protein